MDLTIERLLGWEALDSRGRPTVACAVTLSGGAEAHAVVPSGASTGTHEALERRDGEARYAGQGVRAAVAALNTEIAPALRGSDASDQEAIDARLSELDGTPTLARLGANAVLAASVASAIAAASALRQPLWRHLGSPGPIQLPLPMVNIISGGAHAGRLIDIQDVLAVPLGASSFAEAIEWVARTREGTAEALRSRGLTTYLVADEGGLAAPLSSNRQALELVNEGIMRAGLVPGGEIALAVDVAATQLQRDSSYRFEAEDRTLGIEQLVAELRTWCDELPIVSIEDPVGEDDIDGWTLASDRLRDIQLVGDDLFVTSTERLAAGIERRLANAVLVKPNQVGTISAAKRAVDLARSADYATVLSARSGETEDSWLADLAVAWRTPQLKVGSTTRSERTAKWNRLLRLEAEHPDAEFAGPRGIAPLPPRAP